MTDDKIKDTNKIEDNVLKHTISAEDLKDMLSEEDAFNENTLPPIVMDIEEYDSKQLQKGIDDLSYLCGKIVALYNTGIFSEESILTYLLNEQTIVYNLESLKLNNANNLEISKNQKIMLEKQEL